ncbi:hypothetical protein QR680_006532 [Steinernema hermaphroditum]|uniref:Fatty-acid and retinol-binding protein 1 n=1 Tax=Steinernema hermaphroditum TaxID=289476 RepID=A0AA39HVW0_9BILA|nr:hypothetical protein QR680_006532 [Steinernema hermaphroditum]
MKALFASLALLAALASPPEAAGAAPIGPNVDIFEKVKEFLPPLIHDALDQFTPEGKEAMKKIITEAISRATNGQPMTGLQIMDKLQQASPDDYKLVEKAGLELYKAVAAQSKPVQEAYASAMDVFGSGKAIKTPAAMLPFVQKLQSLSESDRAEFFKLSPSTKQFYNSDAFKEILAGSN